MKKIIICSSLLLISCFQTTAQTISATTAGSVTSSTTIGSGNSVRIGADAGAAMNNATGQSVFIGQMSGNQTIGESNTFVGWASGPYNTTGYYNAFFGRSSGASNNQGIYNTIVGALAGVNNTNGNLNTFLGFGAGMNNISGGGNIFIGPNAGGLATNTNYNLFIDISSTANPLIWGDFANDQVKLNGKVGIGGTSTFAFGNFPTTAGSADVSQYNLFVKGGILTDELRVALNSTWADYVFEKDYSLKSLDEVEKFINENGHLPNVPNAKQVKEDGINIAEMTRIQQEKIEELTLYIIEQNKISEKLNIEVENQAKQIEELKTLILLLSEKVK